MKVCGIIAEFNPFHNGHAYLLAEAKRQTGADYVIVVMSGDYVQRGEPAIIDKHSRCEIALNAGADLVIELPTLIATGSAQYFARGSVGILNALGVVDTLFFGSETGNIPMLKEFAFGASLPGISSEAAFHSPNDILAMEYLKALEYFSSSMIPFTIKREGAGYHDETLPKTGHCSATFLRKEILKREKSSDFPEFVASQMPPFAAEISKHYFSEKNSVSFQDINTLLFYKLLENETKGFANYFDVYDNLSDKIVSYFPLYQTPEDFRVLLKSKEIAFSHISRSLLHILLEITKEDANTYKENGYVSYLRMLGFRETATPLLTMIKKKSAKPLLSKLADAPAILGPEDLKLLKKDIAASHLYQFLAKKEKTVCIPNEYRRPVIIL